MISVAKREGGEDRYQLLRMAVLTTYLDFASVSEDKTIWPFLWNCDRIQQLLSVSFIISL